MTSRPPPGRRRLLVGLAAAPLALALRPAPAAAARPRDRRPAPAPPVPVPAPRPAAGTGARSRLAARLALPPERGLALHHVRTGETLRAVYAAGGRYRPEALRAFAWHLRDWRAGRACELDPGLLDLLFALARRLEAGTAPLHVLCGYRTPETNAMLRRRRDGGGVAGGSLHLRGMAIDLRAPGRPLAGVRDTALGLAAGGVGYYPDSGFVHLDTGPVRRW